MGQGGELLHLVALSLFGNKLNSLPLAIVGALAVFPLTSYREAATYAQTVDGPSQNISRFNEGPSAASSFSEILYQVDRAAHGTHNGVEPIKAIRLYIETYPAASK